MNANDKVSFKYLLEDQFPQIAVQNRDGKNQFWLEIKDAVFYSTDEEYYITVKFDEDKPKKYLMLKGNDVCVCNDYDWQNLR